MLTDRNHLNEKSETYYDLLRTSIAMDRDRVKPLAASESPASGGVRLMESGDGASRQLWFESGECLACHVAGT